MWCYNQAAKVPNEGAAVDFRRDWWHGDVRTSVPPGCQMNFLLWVWAEQWSAGFRAALCTVGSCFISGSLHWRIFTNALKLSPDKHSASQERQQLILFCFHPFSQCTSAKLTDIWISPRRIIPRTFLLNIAAVVGGCKCKGGIWKRLVNSCLGTT